MNKDLKSSDSQIVEDLKALSTAEKLKKNLKPSEGSVTSEQGKPFDGKFQRIMFSSVQVIWVCIRDR